MTTVQIKKFIEDIGYKMNEWNRFDKLAYIKLNSDGTAYTRNEALMYKFNTSTELLEYTSGITEKDGTFVNKYNEKENFTPSGYIDFNNIAGFVMSEKFVGLVSSNPLV